ELSSNRRDIWHGADMAAAAGRPAPPPVAPAVVAAPQKLYIATAEERRLLADGAGHRLVEQAEALPAAAWDLLKRPELHHVTNVAVMKISDFIDLLDQVLPAAWRNLRQVAWAPGQALVQPKQPDEAWVRALWCYICKSCGGGAAGASGPAGTVNGVTGSGGGGGSNAGGRGNLRLFEESGWPLLPATSGVGIGALRVMMRLEAGMPLVAPAAAAVMGVGGSLPGNAVDALSRINVFVLDTAALGPEAASHTVIQNYANKCTTVGVLRAIWSAVLGTTNIGGEGGLGGRGGGGGRSGGDEGAGRSLPAQSLQLISARFSGVGVTGRNALRKFFGDRRNSEVTADATPAELRELLRLLPIWQVYSRAPMAGAGMAAASGGARRSPANYAALTGLRLPPSGADPTLLDETFVIAETVDDKDLLRSLGIEPMAAQAFSLFYVLPRLRESLAQIAAAAGQGPATGQVSRGPPFTGPVLLKAALLLLETVAADSTGFGGGATGPMTVPLAEALRSTAFVPNNGGDYRRACDLYDPRVSELQSLLAPADFPAQECCQVDILSALVSLGMRRALTADGVLQSARSIQAALTSAPAAPTAASAAGPPQLQSLSSR
ncbi:unnamed protein product, partial [Phaeothamnion confervicola]